MLTSSLCISLCISLSLRFKLSHMSADGLLIYNTAFPLLLVPPPPFCSPLASLSPSCHCFCRSAVFACSALSSFSVAPLYILMTLQQLGMLSSVLVGKVARGSTGSFPDTGINIANCPDDCRRMRQILDLKAAAQMATLKGTAMHHFVWLFGEVLATVLLHSPHINLTTAVRLLSSLL